MDRVDYESLIIQDLLGYFDRDELDISPWYQRRSVWSKAQKAYLINTIHENKPVPSIYIRHAVDLATEQSIKKLLMANNACGAFSNIETTYFQRDTRNTPSRHTFPI